MARGWGRAAVETEVIGSESIWKPKMVPRFPHREDGSAMYRGGENMEEARHQHAMKAHARAVAFHDVSFLQS